MSEWLGIQKVGGYLLARSLDEVVNGEIGNQVLCRKLNRPMGHKTLGLVNVQFTEDKKVSQYQHPLSFMTVAPFLCVLQ